MKPVSEMTPLQRRNEAVLILVSLLNGAKCSTAMRHRLAELTGMKCVTRGEKPPVSERHRYITCADLKTPEARKRLCERIIGKEIWVTPVSKTGRKKGSANKSVLDRKRRRAEEFLQGSEELKAPQEIYYSQMRDGKKYDSEVKSVIRDVTKGLHDLDLEFEKKLAIEAIAKSLSEIHARHSK